MANEPPERRLPREEIERMTGLVRPNWRVREATLATDGVTPVYRLRVEGPNGHRDCVLKAARGDDRHLAVGDVGAEARLLAIVGEHTTIPVPEVIGAVDEHGSVRTPFFLMESVAGEKISPDEVGSLPDEMLRRVARLSGRYLGQLHGIGFEAVDGFGRGIQCRRSPPLRGERPAGDPSQLVLYGGYDDFRAQLRDWWEEDFERRHTNGRFDDLAPAIRDALIRHRARLPESLSPVLARLDHGWHNLLVTPGGGEITGVLDWGILSAFPAAYDLALVEVRLAGGSWLALPEVPDRRPTVRDALLAGYRQERPVPPAFDSQRRCYQLDVLQSWMFSLGDDLPGPAIPDDRIDDAADGFRTLVDPLIG